MDRYKFEDSISAYIDNELSLTDRQEFEEYIEKNPDAKSILEDILKKEGKVELVCEFCKNKYLISCEEIKAMIKN